MSAAMEHWYVYYKLQASELARWLPQVPPLFDAVAQATGVQGRLLRRADEPGETTTVMEVYDGVADGDAFERALAAALAGAGAPLAPRRTERFIDLPSGPNR